MKKVRKILPLSIYDIPGIEQWLETQANEGLFPLRVDNWVTFDRTGVPGTRFRLELKTHVGDDPPQEQRELYHAAGWQYAMTVGNAYYLFYTTDPEAPELYSDSHSRGLSLELLEKRAKKAQRWSYIVYGLLVALVVYFLFFFRSKFDAQPDPLAHLPLLLLKLTSPFVLLFLVCAFFSWKRSRRDLRILQATIQALKEQTGPPPSPGPQTSFRRENAATLLLIVPLFVLVLGLNLRNMTDMEMIPLEKFHKPYIPIQTIEQEPVFYWQKLFTEQPFPGEPDTSAEQHFSLLAPIWYDVEQRAYSPQNGTRGNSFSADKEGGKNRYSPSLDMTYIRVLIPALARPVAESQLNAARLVNLRWTYEELNVEGLDFCIIGRPGGDKVWQLAAIGKGRNIAVFRYGGMEDITHHLDTLSAMVK